MTVNTQDTRVCTACKLPKAPGEFYTSTRGDRTAYYGRCKTCHNKHVADLRREKIGRDPEYLKREAGRVASYRSVEGNRKRANARSTANHEALSRLKARYPGQYAAYRAQQLADGDLKRSVALYRAARDLRDKHYNEYKALYREAMRRRGVT